MCIAKTSNFSAPGPDGIQNIWWKQLTATHGHLARIFNNYLKQNVKLGLPKCAAVHITRGKPQEQVLEGIELIDGGILKHLSPDAHYKYLGLQETHTLDATLVKAQSKQKYINRLEKNWGSELSAINKINATNILAMPLLIYTFGVVRWARAELSRLDEATRKIMAKHRSHHPRASTQRLYMSRGNQFCYHKPDSGKQARRSAVGCPRETYVRG
ncbi:hypothetical protein QE152_g40641 [Popillia japonica]|uniref:Reverse transcriptase n=1 Tax=Popillia japonica TaxID=7064 RepID=A0AAW1HFS5_POPJA